MGVSGAGKSTVGRALADLLGWDLLDGDDLHSPADRAKMAAGQPLRDDDRWPWLRRARAWIDDQVTAGRCGVLACSALTRAHRDVLRDQHVVFAYLQGGRDVLLARLVARQGHFMPAALLESQLATLQEPSADEHAITVQVAAPPAAQAADIVAALRVRHDLR